MDFFQGIDWGAYAAMRFQANQMPGLASVLHILHLIGLWGWIPLLALLALPWRHGGVVRQRAYIMFGVAALALLCLVAVRQASDRRRPPDAEILLGPQMGKSFPNIPAFAFPMAGIIAASAWSLAGGRKVALAFLGVALASCIFATAELFLGLAFVSDVIVGLVGGAGFGVLARALASRFASASPTIAAAALQ
jgi:hypothetical protein